MQKTLQKRCENCNKLYSIPLIRTSRALDNLIRFYPCPHCNFHNTEDQKQKCSDCLVPFSVEKFYASFLCKRCYMRRLRILLRNKVDIIL